MASTLVGAPRRLRPRPGVVVAGAALLVVACSVWGAVLSARGVALHLGFVPFYGAFDVRITPGVVLPVCLAALIVTVGSRRAAAWPWPRLLMGGWAMAAAWAASLALATGGSGITGPLDSPYDYYAVLPEVRRLGVATFVRTFLERVPDYPVHVQGHPPGLPVLYGVLDVIGLAGPGWAAAVVIAIGASTVPAVLIATRAVAGADAARAAAPFLVLAPFALFVATTGDAVFMAAAAWSIALLVLALTAESVRRAGAFALAGGAAAGLTLFLTYGAMPLLVAVPAAVATSWTRRRVRPLMLAAVGAGAVVLAWRAAGFWWLGGVHATHHFYGLRAGNDRPYGYFFVANLAVLGAMLGPAVLAGFTRLRDGGVIRLVAGAAVAVVVADLSGLSKAEVERIWLPFMPWLTLAVVDLVRDEPRHQRRWLAAQAGLAVALQLVVAWPW
jgi:methylthioxylose transferase